MDISLRPVRNSDYNFLWNLHKATMKTYVDETWGWNEDFQKEYLDDNFDTQIGQIIECDNKSIGVIEVKEQDNSVYLINLELVPEFQGRGIGTYRIKRIAEENLEKNKSIKLQVLKVNPAQRLYRRLSFKVIDETETHVIMKRK